MKKGPKMHIFNFSLPETTLNTLGSKNKQPLHMPVQPLHMPVFTVYHSNFEPFVARSGVKVSTSLVGSKICIS